MRTGWQIGSLFGIPLFLDTSWFLILFFITLLYGSFFQNQLGLGPLAFVVGFLLALLLFVSVLLHELGHSLAAQAQGIKVNSITLFIFGGIASIDKESKTPEKAFQVAIAGPLVSFGLYLIMTLSSLISLLPEVAQIVVSRVAEMNLVLTLFNLIPGLPLDGGQVLKAAVWKATGSRTQGVRWAARVGQALGWTAIILGLFAYLATQRLDLLWIALIGWFAVSNASAYSRVTDLQEAIASLNASEAMVREFRVVDADMSLRQFADQQLLQEGRPPVYFAASNGRYRGMVSIDDLREVERSQWESRTLHSVAHPLTEIPSVRERASLPEVIEKLEALKLSRITVLTPADAVGGVIDRGDIVRALAQKMNLPISEAVIQRIKEEGAYPPGLQLQVIAKATAD
ncbi:MAG: site-2 protease family protein [Pseudanabaenales cyanobacterium]|nr:site-2 protease family protein [Pseudanabaenales cyanobacterium]